MKTITPEILKSIDPYIIKVRKSIAEAVSHFQETLGRESAFITPLTKASYIRDFILENIKREFFGIREVGINKKRGMITLVIYTDPIIILKFKKFDRYNRVSSNKTMQSFLFTNQLHLFPEFSETINLHAGYKWNDTGTMIDCIIGLPTDERTHAWTVIIPDRGEPKEFINNQTQIEPIKPTITLKVKQIRKSNEKAS